MEQFIAGRRASGFYVQHIADNRDKMIESFLMAARALIEEDRADVIIPQGITQCPVQMKPEWLSEQLGVPVVEGIGAPIRHGRDARRRSASSRAACAGRRQARSRGDEPIRSGCRQRLPFVPAKAGTQGHPF